MSGSTHSYDVASMLVNEGHDVTVITATNRVKQSSVEIIDGIKIYWLRSTYYSKMSFVERAVSFIDFMIQSSILLLKNDCDLVFATSTPLTIGLPAIIKKIFHHTPYVFEVRDLWPSVPVEMGILKNKFIIKFLQYFEHAIYCYASKIFVISDGIAQLIDAPIDKIKVFPFGCDMKKYKTVKKSSFKQDNNFNDKIVVGLIGSLGIANDPFIILETAKLLQKMKNNTIHFVLFGDGSAKAQIEKRVNNEKIDNVTLYEQVNKKEALSIIKEIDAGLILHGKSSVYRFTASPNKFFDYLALNLHIIYNFEGPLKELLEKEKVGYYFNYNDSSSLANYLNCLDKKEIDRAIKNNYRLANSVFNMEIILKKMNHEITMIDF